MSVKQADHETDPIVYVTVSEAGHGKIDHEAVHVGLTDRPTCYVSVSAANRPMYDGV